MQLSIHLTSPTERKSMPNEETRVIEATQQPYELLPCWCRLKYSLQTSRYLASLIDERSRDMRRASWWLMRANRLVNAWPKTRNILDCCSSNGCNEAFGTGTIRHLILRTSITSTHIEMPFYGTPVIKWLPSAENSFSEGLLLLLLILRDQRSI